MHFPPGFGSMNVPLPRATKEAFGSLHSIFPQLFFIKGGQGGFLAWQWGEEKSLFFGGALVI
jgi:hypothetical protein